jgi:hypothetical protein
VRTVFVGLLDRIPANGDATMYADSDGIEGVGLPRRRRRRRRGGRPGGGPPGSNVHEDPLE